MMIEQLIAQYYLLTLSLSLGMSMLFSIWSLLFVPKWAYLHSKNKTRDSDNITINPFNKNPQIHYSFLLLSLMLGTFILGMILLPLAPILVPLIMYVVHRNRVNNKIDRAVAIINGEQVDS